MSSLEERVGDYRLRLTVEPPGNVKTSCRGPSGLISFEQAANLNVDMQVQCQQFKVKAREIRKTIKDQKVRLEESWLLDNWIPGRLWQDYYASHSLMRVLITGLVWLIDDGEYRFSAIFDGEHLLRQDGQTVLTAVDQMKFRLWHPLHGDNEENRIWRQYILTNSIEQPIRQVFREVYDGNVREIYDATFKGLYVRQHQFRALLLEQGWRYALQRSREDQTPASRKLPNGQTVVLEVNTCSDSISARGISLAIEIGDLKLFTADGREGTFSGLPKLMGSEVLRQIDLFAAVTGVGTAEDWSILEDYLANDSDPILLSLLTTRDNLLKLLINHNPDNNISFIRWLFAIHDRLDSRRMYHSTQLRSELLEALFKHSKFKDSVFIQKSYVHVDGLDSRSYRISIATGVVFDEDRSLVAFFDTRLGQKPAPAVTGRDPLVARIFLSAQKLVYGEGLPKA